jgi:hypothetical protein
MLSLNTPKCVTLHEWISGNHKSLFLRFQDPVYVINGTWLRRHPLYSLNYIVVRFVFKVKEYMSLKISDRKFCCAELSADGCSGGSQLFSLQNCGKVCIGKQLLID